MILKTTKMSVARPNHNLKRVKWMSIEQFEKIMTKSPFDFENA